MRIEEVIAEYAPSNWRRRHEKRSPRVNNSARGRVAQAWVFDSVDVGHAADATDCSADSLRAYLSALPDTAVTEMLAAAFSPQADELREFKLGLEIL